jgi:mannose/cellobiose epimerase-like protein (N-acyl-D-glucosamine 2-epimerase family)
VAVPAAAQSAETLLLYLASAADGLWYDCLTVNGRFVEEPAPASSFCHIVGAIVRCGRKPATKYVEILIIATPRCGLLLGKTA